MLQSCSFFFSLSSVHTQETRSTAKTNTLSLSRSRNQTSSSVSPRCDMSHGAYAHNKENQQTRERNQKTVYSPGAINEQVCVLFFFPETSGQRQPSVVTQYILSDGEATTGPGGKSKQAVQAIYKTVYPRADCVERIRMPNIRRANDLDSVYILIIPWDFIYCKECLWIFSK